MSVSVNPPKTPVTKGSNGVASATVPNICKMPGPPAPFVPTPLPNIGKSGNSPEGYTKKVKVEGKTVAIKGASFKSTGDAASKGTGGGLVSSNTHGPTKFAGPGSMDVKFEGKNVQLLSDPMLNNCGPSGSPPNAATLIGLIQAGGMIVYVQAGEKCPVCGEGDHAELAENKATKTSAGKLAEEYGKDKKMKHSSVMLGIVQCKCDKKYAAKSGKTHMRFPKVAESAGASAAAVGNGTTVATLEGLSDFTDAKKDFETAWTTAHKGAKKYNAVKYKNDEDPPVWSYPGNCAAQKALLVCLEDHGIPAALTEQWYAGEKERDQTTAPIAHLKEVETSSGLVMKSRVEKFSHGQSVPPCKTCELLLPFLLCFGEDDQCSHKK